jgi:uncharacterized protein (DUF885 family)
METLPARLLLPMLVVIAFAASARASGEEDAKLEAFFKSYLDQRFHQQPLDASRLGDHRFDHLLDDVSPEGRAAWKARDRHTLDDLPHKIDYKKLSRAGQIDYEIWAHDLEYSLWQYDNEHRFENDPRVYNDYISDSVYLLLVQSTVPKAEAVKSCIGRMAFIGRDRHPSKSRRHLLLRERSVRAGRRDAAAQRDEARCGTRGRRAEGLPAIP